MSSSASDIRPHCSWRVHATDYVRGELERATCARFEEHLVSCPSCRLEIEAARETVDILRAAPGITRSRPDPGLPERVIARIPGNDWKRGDRARRPGFAAICSAAALVMAAVTLIVFRAGNREPVPGDVVRPEPVGSKMHSSGSEGRRGGSTIIRARNWLVSAQESDGSWDPQRWRGNASFRVALTGLAVLALSGCDHDGPSREASSRAIGFLLRNQGDNGLIGRSFRSSLYNHAIATLALLEASDSRRTGRPAIDRALSLLHRTQTRGGAWGYVNDDEGTVTLENESISIWALQALVRAGSLDFETDSRAIEKGFQWFERNLTSPATHRRYRGRAGHECGQDSLRPISVWAVVLRGKRSPTGNTRLAADHMVKTTLSEKSSLSFYESYFLLKTLSVLEVSALEEVQSKTQRNLADSQVKEGSLAGSWDPNDRWSPVGGRIYSTALAALALKGSET